MMDFDKSLLEKAYKKLKSSVYFDKTQLILRNEIVEFETRINNLDNYFAEMIENFTNKDKFKKLQQDIISSISVLSFPKKLSQEKVDIIINSASEENEIEELQHFIHMDVRGHILGVLWLMLIGYRIDEKVYQHSYGNRIRRNLLNEMSGNPTYSPYLFEPYFEQYESWRDKAMTEASKHLSLNHDVIIITMDFRRYYYSVDMDQNSFKLLLKDAFGDDYKEDMELLTRLNFFVSAIIEQYSKLFDEKRYANRNILPIGFLPSNVISNWCLKNFDKAIVDGWNPVYYGRYVDDILIIDKVEHNSDIYKKSNENQLSRDDVVDFFLKQCSKWRGIGGLNCKKSNKYALIEEDELETSLACQEAYEKNESACIDNIHVFRVNSLYNAIPNDNSKIVVHNEKVKIFYFKSGESDALLTCFKKNIANNKSEFRHLPEDDAIFQKDDYSEIYSLKTSDTLNKFRGIDGLSIDKFELSKFLGKNLRIGGMIKDKVESQFEKDVLKIFNTRSIIENYIVWEKVIEVFVINEHFETTKKFIKRVIEAINTLKYSKDDKTASVTDIQGALYMFLHSAISRSFALVWKKECKDIISFIYINENLSEKLLLNKFWWGACSKYLKVERQAYCKTRMIDKSVMPIIIDMIKKEFTSSDANINLTSFYEVLSMSKRNFKSDYKFYPYLVNMYDLSMVTCIEELKKKSPYQDLDEIHVEQTKRYISINYNIQQESEIENLVAIAPISNVNASAYQIAVDNGKKDKLKVAIANVKLNHNNFELLVKDLPNRCYARYRDISSLVNQAIDQKVDMLIMPESFVPFEWLSTLARTCARNNLAIVTGVEHIKYDKKIFNFTAVILPYIENSHKCAYISFHLKKHYAPSEKQEINGYGFTEVVGTHYELYKWSDCYFPVYCCYELASISDRALFRSYADLLVTVEWNRDVKYYSNILESLSRDIHCYCIQVNSSDYGDSRITKPSKSEEKDIIRTKGGKNSIILVDEIDISRLRDFQLKGYDLQIQSSQFKITPPDFDRSIIMRKIKNLPINID